MEMLPGPMVCTQVAGVRQAVESEDLTAQTWAGPTGASWEPAQAAWPAHHKGAFVAGVYETSQIFSLSLYEVLALRTQAGRHIIWRRSEVNPDSF